MKRTGASTTMMMRHSIYAVAGIALILQPILAQSYLVNDNDNNNNHRHQHHNQKHRINGDSNSNKTRAVEESLSETLPPAGRCQKLSSCKAREPQKESDTKINCYCDQKCQLYDDCCQDSPFTESIRSRYELGTQRIQERRSQWHCRRINDIFGDIVLRASCLPEWLRQQDDHDMAQLIGRRCEYVKDRGKAADDSSAESRAAQSDPIGMMMPITDLASGITYANSYCLRCNTLASMDPRKGQLLYWSPMLECNYNTVKDERNTLIDLISSKKGQALKYSNERNKWIIATKETSNNRTTNTTSSTSERVCSIKPTIPDLEEQMIRFCRADLIRTCPSKPPAEAEAAAAATTTTSTTRDLSTANETVTFERARLECQFGHQSITYSLTSRNAVYYNPGCAICNGEQRFFCEPKSSRGFAPLATSKIVVVDGPARPMFAPPSDSDMLETTTSTPEDGTFGVMGLPDDEESGARERNNHGSSVIGSFTLLMDLYGSSQDETSADLMAESVAGQPAQQTNPQQQQQQQCPDPQSQVFDPFYSTCRDLFCGLNHKFVDGKCVDKFKPAMVYITDVCLIISITSLALYLILYALSTFDLRPLAVELAQWECEAAAAEVEQERPAGESHSRFTEGSNKQQDISGGAANGCGSSKLKGSATFASQKRHSRTSNEGSTASGPTSGQSQAGRHSQSLSTRGVASLSASLLAAYLLFMLGHQTETGIQARRQPICAGLAAATYYCFLAAFCWMFLLAYDIWRTLRLATCQLRAPAMHSQSGRFLSYALLALLLSATLVGLAVLIDQLPPVACEHHPQLLPAPEQQQRHHHNGTAATSGGSRGSCAGNWWTHFVQVYRPNFGHQPGSCWFSNRRALALFFGLPVTLIMVANLMFFLHSSCMVLRTSSRSSRQLSKSSSSATAAPLTPSHHHHLQPAKFVSLEKGLAQADSQSQSNNLADFSLQNSLTTSSIVSVQTLQSHLSASSSSGSEESLNPPSMAPPTQVSSSTPPPPPPDGAKEEAPGLPMPPLPPSTPLPLPARPAVKHAKLDPSLSSNSLATNHSTCSHHSIASSLALKYDSHLQSLQSMMGSILKDYRLYCRLSTIMGLTWLTGLLASLVDQSDTLWYLFVVLNTLQGLFIFIAFGCKRSKLSNLQLLFDYLKFWLLHRCCCARSSSKKSSQPEAASGLADSHRSRRDSLSSSQSSGGGGGG